MTAEESSMVSGSDHTIEQVNHYRNGAAEAANLAKPCDDSELRDAYLGIARAWTELADKLERDLRAARGEPA